MEKRTMKIPLTHLLMTICIAFIMSASICAQTEPIVTIHQNPKPEIAGKPGIALPAAKPEENFFKEPSLYVFAIGSTIDLISTSKSKSSNQLVERNPIYARSDGKARIGVNVAMTLGGTGLL